ncbi:MAG TPA: hypothetical protein VEZ70_07240 [Allosphingosinicella sp.]|nr:hypothetical protein [Allosphingosinicella sp.]
MPLYFFHLRDGVDILLDPEGRQIDKPDAIPEVALREARSIIGDDAARGRILLDQHIDVEDEARNVLHTLHFVDAVEIVYP